MNYVTTVEDTYGMVYAVTHPNLIDKMISNLYYHNHHVWYNLEAQRIDGYLVSYGVFNLFNVDDAADMRGMYQWYINEVVNGNADGLVVYETEDVPDTYTIELVDWYPTVELAVSAASKETGAQVFDVEYQEYI